MEEGFQKPCGTTSVCAGSGWRATRRTGRGGRRGRVGEREGVGPAVAKEAGIEARVQVVDVDPAVWAGAAPSAPARGAAAAAAMLKRREEEERTAG